jgi:hypothetical protein
VFALFLSYKCQYTLSRVCASQSDKEFKVDHHY